MGMSCVYKLKSWGESTAPCGTPFWRAFVFEVQLLRTTLPFLAVMREQSHLLKLLSICVFRIFLVRTCLETESKALLMSSATMTVRKGGLRALKPAMMVCDKSVRYVIVECCARNPC